MIFCIFTCKRNLARGARAAKAIALTGIMLTASCTSSTYMGIPLGQGAAPSDLQWLAYRARGGDKHAQLKLGTLFEYGNGVKRSKKHAMSLYNSAADSESEHWIYVASHGAVGAQFITASPANHSPGLPEARRRLEALRANGEEE